MAEKNYDPAKVLDYNKRYGIRREPEDRARVRAWASENGVAVNATGRVPEEVFMAWIDAHAGQPNPVISHKRYKDQGVTYRVVKVICHSCGKMHEHGGELGTRPAVNDNHRVAHCTDPYAGGPGYHLADQLPVEQWELDGLAKNEEIKAQAATK